MEQLHLKIYNGLKLLQENQIHFPPDLSSEFTKLEKQLLHFLPQLCKIYLQMINVKGIEINLNIYCHCDMNVCNACVERLPGVP